MWLGLKVCDDRKEELPTGRERCYVLSLSDILVAEVRDFGVKPRVIRPGLQIAPAEFQTDVLCLTTENLAGQVRWQPIRQRELAQFDEGAILGVHRLSAAIRLEPRSPQHGICSETRSVEVVVREVDDLSSLPPVQKAGKPDWPDVEVVAETHLVVRLEVPVRAVLLVIAATRSLKRYVAPDLDVDLGRGLIQLDTTAAVYRRERAARQERGDCERGDLPTVARERRVRNPVQPRPLNHVQIQADLRAVVHQRVTGLNDLRRESSGWRESGAEDEVGYLLPILRH